MYGGGFAAVPAYLAEKGRRLKEGYNLLAKELGVDGYTRCTGYDCRSLVSFDASAGNPLELKSYVQQELIKRGALAIVRYFWMVQNSMN